MAQKNLKLEKREEKLHKDLDNDGEKGESATHRNKVLGKAVSSKKLPITKKGKAKGCGCPPGPCRHEKK